MDLAAWLSATHVAGAGFVRAGGAGDPALWLADGWLRPDKLAALGGLFAGDAAWVDSHGLLDQGGRHCSEAAWLAAPADRRFWRYRQMQGVAPGREMSAGWLHWLRFRSGLLTHPDLLAALARVTGISLAGRVDAVPLLQRRGDFLALHSDRTRDRLLCGVFYLSDGWQPAYGGEFEMTAGGNRIHHIEPRANRLILFDPRETGPTHEAPPLHRASPLAEAAGGWSRCSFSIWWKSPLLS